MPLPTGDVAWPPKPLATILPAMAEWSAWYAGDPTLLRNASSEAANGRHVGGILGVWRRLWWGRTLSPTQRHDGLHVPLAADICQGSAELLYAEPPSVSVVDAAAGDPTVARLQEYADDDLHGELLAGAEVGAALGGRFHKVAWDREVRDRPFITTVHADNAHPEFRWGRLQAVTFWWVVQEDEYRVLRHLERHELAPSPAPGVPGDGLVYHGLYEGTKDTLGRLVPLTDHPSTASLATEVDEDGAIIEGRTPGLSVVYVPNRRPQRTWRTHPIGSHLGRSDLDGIVSLLDALDEAWSSWMRDLRLSKARILAAESALDVGAPGSGGTFDLDREVFTPLPGVLPKREGAGLPIEVVQFDIRTEQHDRLIGRLVDTIIRQAGYSARTFTDPEPGTGDKTAAEVRAEQGRSMLTRSHKMRHEKDAVRRLLRKMLATDVAVFGTAGINPDAPLSVSFPESIQESTLALANTSQALYNARAASTATRVKMLHPDWAEDDVAAEVAAINAEQGMGPAGDPFGRYRSDGSTVDEE